MEKTKLGLSVGVLGALAYFAAYFGGYIPALLVAGYILIAEEDLWLKKTAVRAVVIMVGFSLIGVAISLIPDLFDLLNSLLRIFNGYVPTAFVNNLFSFVNNVIYFVKLAIFVCLGLTAFKKADFKLPLVDDLVK